MSNLKNTPWKAEMLHQDIWSVKDCEGWPFCVTLDEPTARAIAALPQTLERLERLEKAAQFVLRNWEGGKVKTKVPNLMNKLKKALEDEQ